MASMKIGVVKHIAGRSLLRSKERLKLVILYLGCFLLTGFLAYVERQATSSYVWKEYFTFILDNQRAFILSSSVIVLVFHYQLLVNSRTEVRCRVLVGDRLILIKLRYGVECLVILTVCCALFLALHLLLGFAIANSLYLFAVLALYILISAVVMRG